MESSILDEQSLKINQFWKWVGNHELQLEREFSRGNLLHAVVQLRNKLKAISPNLRFDFAYNADRHMFFLALTSIEPVGEKELVEAINSSFPGIDHWDNSLWARYQQLVRDRRGPDYELNFERLCRRVCAIRYRVDKVVKETRQMYISLLLPNYRFHLDQDYSMQVGKDLIAVMLGDSTMKDVVVLTSTGPVPEKSEDLFDLIDLARHAEYLRPLDPDSDRE